MLRDGAGLGVKEPYVGGSTNYNTLFEVHAGDVVVRTITAFESPVAVAHTMHHGAHVSQVFLTYEVSSSADPNYLELVFQTKPFWAEMRHRASGTVMRRKTISHDSFCGIPIELPPLAVQRRIVDLVTSMDAHIVSLELESSAAERTLEAARRMLMTSQSLLPLEDVLAAAKAGGTPDRSRPDFYGGDVLWLKSGEVDNAHIRETEETITAAGLVGSSAWILPANTPVIAMYGATAAVSGFVEVPMATNQAVLALVPNPAKADARFLFHWLRLNGTRLKAAATGAAQPNLSKQVVLRETGFPDIPLSEQRAITATLDSVSDLAERLRQERGTHAAVRRATVSALLSAASEIPEGYDKLLGEVA